MRHVCARLASVLLVCAGLVGGTPTATAAPPGTVPGLPVALALGDSVAAGVGAGATEAERRSQGYVGLLHERMRAALDCVPAASPRPSVGCRQLQLVDLSVGGATTGSLIATQLPTALELLTARNGDANPRNDVEVVTVTIGGNDLFTPVVGACVAPPPDPARCAATIQQAFGSVGANLDHILGSLRGKAGPDTEIVLMTYYNPLPACFLASSAPLADVVLEGGSLPGLPPLQSGFNDLLRSVATAHDVSIADTYGRLGVDDLVGGADCLHPDASGHAVIAGLFADTLGLTGAA